MHKEPLGYRLIEVNTKLTKYLLEGSIDGCNWHVIKDTQSQNTDLPHDFILFESPLELRFIRLSHMLMPYDGVPAISGLRAFGKGNGTPPASVENVKFSRQNRLNILLHWDKVENANGYNVRYGIAPDKLYNSWQIYDVNELDLCMVNAESSYYIVVDSFNENGVTSGTPVFVD